MELDFSTIINIIEIRRRNAYVKVNEELILMYWDFGKYVSELTRNTKHGEKCVLQIVEFMKVNYPGIKGFGKRGLYRMKQFYEMYKDNIIVSPLVTQISWTNNLLILSSTKTMEEKEFYIRLCIKYNYSKRELERQSNENPSVGVILCSDKNETIVNYSLSRSISPTSVSKYKLELIDKKILERKIEEIKNSYKEKI